MEPRKPSPSAGKRLKALRESLGLTTREVEEKSKQIARDRHNEEYYISHAWVTDIENGGYAPSIYKLYTFSAVYHRRYDEIVSLFGLSMSDLKRYQASLGVPNTHLLAGDFRAGHGKGLPPRAFQRRISTGEDSPSRPGC